MSEKLAIDLIPNPKPADGLADGGHFASSVATDDHREHGWHDLAEGTIGELPIHGVEAGGFNTNEDLACRRLWYRELGDPERSSREGATIGLCHRARSRPAFVVARA